MTTTTPTPETLTEVGTPAVKCRHEWATKHTPEVRWVDRRSVRDVGPRGGKMKTWHIEEVERVRPASFGFGWQPATPDYDEADEDELFPVGMSKEFTCIHCLAKALVGHDDP